MEHKLSAPAAAARFGIGVATAIVWVPRARETGSRIAKPRAQSLGSKLDVHRETILGWIEAKSDITIAEIREKLLAEHDIAVGVGTVWVFLDRCGLTFKKRPLMPVNKRSQMYSSGVKNGLRASPTLIPKD